MAKTKVFGSNNKDNAPGFTFPHPLLVQANSENVTVGLLETLTPDNPDGGVVWGKWCFINTSCFYFSSFKIFFQRTCVNVCPG